jgi:PAS domain S-box-containing protein
VAFPAGRFEEFAEALPQFVWVAAPDGTIEYVNQPWADYTGLTADDLRGTGVKGVVHPNELGATWELWTRALATGTPYEIEYRLRCKSDGTYRWFIARAAPVRDERGAIVSWIGTATDIDAQKRANANLRFVMEASATLSASYDVDTICAELARLAVDRIADWCSIVLLEENGAAYRTAAVAHRDPSLNARVADFREHNPVRPGTPFDTAIRKNVPVLISTAGLDDFLSAGGDPLYLEMSDRIKPHSAMLVPLAGDDGAVYGGISFVSAESARSFGSEDLQVAEMVAHRAAAAIHTAKIFDEERRRSQNLQFIARASELAFESFDLRRTLQNLCEFVAGETADLVYIMLVENGTALRTMASAHRDPSKAAIAARLRGERTLRPDAEDAAMRMLSQHRVFVHPHVLPEHVLPNMWEYLAPDVRALNLRSAITVPLFSRGETLGVLTAYWCETPRAYSERDVPVFADLGRRLSVAIEHIKTVERERRIAESLQQALLPSTELLPKSHILTVNAQYRPSSHEADVGGDWYDAVRLPDASIMLCVGDVTGRGLLAAGLMGKMRQAINMASMYEPDPARLLDAIDFQLRTRGSQALVTAFVGILAPDGKSMRYANAGHPPPLLRRAGEIEELRSTGLPIGLRDAAERETTVELSLEGAELLALYTDGLTEGTRDLAFGERRLREVISTDAILNVRNPAQFLCEACLPFDAQDDTAVLTVLFEKRTQWSFDAENARAAQEARSQFLTALRERSRPDADFSSAELVFGELIGNVVRHAPGPIDVQLEWPGAEPVLHVIDRGRGFIRDPALPLDPLSESGRGLYIIAELARELRIERIPGYGNHVSVALRL